MQCIVSGQYFSFTKDAWSYSAHVPYITNTIHFVNTESQLLHSFLLGIFQKDGRSTTMDIVKYVETTCLIQRIFVL
jgi:hypothetical protein